MSDFRSLEHSYLHQHYSAVELIDCEVCGSEFESEGTVEYGVFEPHETICPECKFKRMNIESNEADVF